LVPTVVSYTAVERVKAQFATDEPHTWALR